MTPREALELAKRHNIVLDASAQKRRADGEGTGGTTPRGRRVTQVCCRSVFSCVASPETTKGATSTQGQFPFILPAASKGPIPSKNKVPGSCIPHPHPFCCIKHKKRNVAVCCIESRALIRLIVFPGLCPHVIILNEFDLFLQTDRITAGFCLRVVTVSKKLLPTLTPAAHLVPLSVSALLAVSCCVRLQLMEGVHNLSNLSNARHRYSARTTSAPPLQVPHMRDRARK